VSHRPLVFVSGLTIADYLLWNWSLNTNHDVLALVAGLTLPPLAVSCLWLLALSAARVIARSARHPAARTRRRGRANAGAARGNRRRIDGATVASDIALEEGSATSAAAGTSSRKLAA
jgi:hypothetical protein